MEGTALVRKWVDAVNRADVEAFGRVYAADAVLYVPVAPDGVKGRQAIVGYEGRLFDALSDVSLKASPVLTGGDSIAVEWEYRGKHTGNLVLPTQTVAATNRQLHLKGASFLRMSSQGEIAEEHRYYNPTELFTQLGIA